VNIPVLLGLAWIAFLTRSGVVFVAGRRDASGSLPGLPQLPERSLMAKRAAAFSHQPVPTRIRSRAARRRLNVLCFLFGAVVVTFLTAFMFGSAAAWAGFAVASCAFVVFVLALINRRQVRRQNYVDRLWTRDRYDDLGHARVMSLEEARNRAEQIATPVYVPARRIS
jgi:hypothetical protein